MTMNLLSRIKKLEEKHITSKEKIKFITLHPGEEFIKENYPGIDNYEVVIIDDLSLPAPAAQ